MSWKSALSFFFFLIVFVILLVYWFFPLNQIQFKTIGPSHSNFTLNSSTEENMQFYNNLRYPEKRISYRIENCPLQKKADMEGAFMKIESLTNLDFYLVNNNEEILVTCESKTRFEGEFFIAGEGGVTNVTQAGDFNVIRKGGILLLRDSDCENPNVAIHELLHSLGFAHSKNPKNIMYEVSKCGQEIGKDTIDLINELYSIPSAPDLMFENASASLQGKSLDVAFVIRNNGLKDAGESTIQIYTNDKLVKEINTKEIPIGSGRLITLTNILVLQSGVSEVKLLIKYDSEELKKENNEVVLKIEN